MAESDSHERDWGRVDSKIEEEIERLKKDVGSVDPNVRRLQLFRFFRLAHARRIISGLNPDRPGLLDPIFVELVQLVHDEMGNDRFKLKRFKEFAQADYTNVEISKAFVVPLYLSIRRTKKFKESRSLRDLYRAVFGSEEYYLPHHLLRLKRPGTELPTKQTTKVFGDYLLLRLDDDDLVRSAFFRLYEHENLHIRSLGLRLDEDHGRISSKGWVIPQQNGLLVSGYIVNRKNPKGEITMDGGYSNLWIDDDAASPLYQEHEGKICLTTALHFQAPFGQFPSAACGVFIRVKGLEKQGGQYHQPRNKRNIATYNLQSSLIDRFREPLSVNECSELLQNRSNIDASLFSEVLESPPFSPTRILEPARLDPHDDIYIDGRQPLHS